jgi:hypothetical protein
VASSVSDRARPKATSWPVAEIDTVPDSTCRRYGDGFSGTPTTNLRMTCCVTDKTTKLSEQRRCSTSVCDRLGRGVSDDYIQR